MKDENLKEMLLSIVVPVYNMNKGNLLKNCIESLIAQTVIELGPYEIILVDDKSTDDSLSVLYEYQKQYPDRIKVIARKSNGKQGAARNDGIRAAKGKWIGFVDSDDSINPDMYYRLIKRADETGADCATCNSRRITDLFGEKQSDVHDGIINETKFTEGIIDDVQIERTVCMGEDMWNKIYMRKMFIDNDIYFPENIFYEDNAVASFFNILSHYIAVVNEPLYYYSFNPDSTCNNMSKEKIEDRIKAGQYFMETAVKLKLYERYKKILECGLFCSVYVGGVPHVWAIKCSQKERYELLKSIRSTMKNYLIDFKQNDIIKKYYPLMIRSYNLLSRSVRLYMLYHYFRNCKEKLRSS